MPAMKVVMSKDRRRVYFQDMTRPLSVETTRPMAVKAKKILMGSGLGAGFVGSGTGLIGSGVRLGGVGFGLFALGDGKGALFVELGEVDEDAGWDKRRAAAGFMQAEQSGGRR